MNESSEILENLINSFAKLPGIGRKTARRLAYFIINSDSSTAGDFARSILEAKSKLGLCSICYNLTEHGTCEICRDSRRDNGIICVVENFSDLYLFEKLSVHKGSYHVLGGLINPLDGINPSSLKLFQLFERIDSNAVSEVIIGLNHSVEGDTTALYIADRLKGKNIKISRLATGIPIGGEIEYTDEITLKQAFRDRKDI